MSDTSVLIDLGRGTFLEPAFRLPFEFTVPDLLYERELKEHDGPHLIKLGLCIEELDGDEVALALSYFRKCRTLSLVDSFALALAKARSRTLLSGDRGLRKLAVEEGVSCHGVLWLLDRLFDHGIVSGRGLRTGLTKIAAHPRCRLPRPEIHKRLLSYSDT